MRKILLACAAIGLLACFASTTVFAGGGDCNPGLVGPPAPCYINGEYAGRVGPVLGGHRYHGGHHRYARRGWVDYRPRVAARPCGGCGSPARAVAPSCNPCGVRGPVGPRNVATASGGGRCTMGGDHAGEIGFVWSDGRCHHLSPDAQ